MVRIVEHQCEREAFSDGNRDDIDRKASKVRNEIWSTIVAHRVSSTMALSVTKIERCPRTLRSASASPATPPTAAPDRTPAPCHHRRGARLFKKAFPVSVTVTTV